MLWEMTNNITYSKSPASDRNLPAQLLHFPVLRIQECMWFFCFCLKVAVMHRGQWQRPVALGPWGKGVSILSQIRSFVALIALHPLRSSLPTTETPLSFHLRSQSHFSLVNRRTLRRLHLHTGPNSVMVSALCDCLYRKVICQQMFSC